MSEALTIPETNTGAIGPGKLVLVVGPSGAGKDTLLGLARTACADDPNVVFARRVVTREASDTEDNEQMNVEGFREAQARGAFAAHWEAHGHAYGLPRSIQDDIRAGRTVIANVSRTVISALRHAYVNVVVVSITAPADVLAARLAMRKRGSDGNIAQRLARTVEDAEPDATIVNVSSAEYHARQLLRIISDDK
ncbi:phosphonate metabolism protein/1,5-bisphosphokinase (PRPP-forming) PhnN [Bradyrhizobium sp. WSM 1738]|uniref:phosphonate metabolism protein/1,5-bisphosphokinase (PRPP-forming) PhnN n=1 Tax=Bradyrhizobium hereditatis TaxID=2821405 RepID=UPI001CE31302|nr:phosphonate metabolism protein/1,5-bisphosphokinase (PRPP-forming) PhnN [Bradyrhizobium hereditatis]MCA6119351.1 phosphonate metabolism protein/1,5-bisphosphokinase (PRPP-forming) PhnN [Bradyrhizobium hereditatis]